MTLTLLSLISLILVEGCSGAHPSNVSDIASDTHETTQPNSTTNGTVGENEDTSNIVLKVITEKREVADIPIVQNDRDPLTINSDTTEKLHMSQSDRIVENHRTIEKEKAPVNETPVRSDATDAQLQIVNS